MVTGSCVFCGAVTAMTGEHVLGDWLLHVGLDLQPRVHIAGYHNRLVKPLGVTTPFTRTVKDVCGPCNNGWMSNLEAVAKRRLTRFIMGEHGTLATASQAAVATWAQKTILVAMLVSSESERAAGYGLPPAEYHALYDRRELVEPLPASTFWISRYTGSQRLAAVWVTPLTVEVDGLINDQVLPHAYVMTLVLGQLILHGVRFTTPTLEVTSSQTFNLSRIWPPTDDIIWPGETGLGDGEFDSLARGLEIKVAEPQVYLRPWRPATELPASTLAGSTLRLPLACGLHTATYPAMLAQKAILGQWSAFLVSCSCKVTYLIETSTTGAHLKLAGVDEAVRLRYESRQGTVTSVTTSEGQFFFKTLNAIP